MYDETSLNVCGYKSPEGHACQKQPTDGDFCVFHQGCNIKFDEGLPTNPHFQSAFNLLLEQKDGNWDGFVFPSEFKLPNSIEFPVSLRRARFTALESDNTTFQNTIDFSDALFLGKAVFRRVTFKSNVIFDRCRFEDSFELQHTNFKSSTSFKRAEFSKRAVFRAHFVGSCNLNETTFREGVNFAGWSETFLRGLGKVSLPGSTNSNLFKQAQAKLSGLYHHKIRRFITQDPHLKTFRVFEDEGHIQDVVFVRPDQVSFSKVDLSKVYFTGTNLRGVRFLGVNFWQPKLGRNGLYDELFIRLSKDGPFRFQNLPALEQTCRNVRVSLEESRDFNVASDFYIAEMEALSAQLGFLRRYLFSIAACYRFVSFYGISVGRGLPVFALLFILHLILSLYFNPETICQSVEHIAEQALRTTKIMSLQMISLGDSDKLTNEQHWLDAIFRILAPIQITMLVLAFRTRIKRS